MDPEILGHHADHDISYVDKVNEYRSTTFEIQNDGSIKIYVHETYDEEVYDSYLICHDCHEELPYDTVDFV